MHRLSCQTLGVANAALRLPSGKLMVMPSIHACALPDQAFLAEYTRNGAYTDCYVAEIDRHVPHAEYVEAFYTGTLFKLERLLIAWFASKPSTDAQAKQLASGRASTFSAWRVEDRNSNQLLMCDLSGRTRSWLMVAPATEGSSAITRLYFGSAVVPVVSKQSGEARFGFMFTALLGFHKIYSRALLSAARSCLARSASTKHAAQSDA